MANKKMAKTVAMVVVMCLLALGYYAYLSERNFKKQQEENLTEVDELLLMDLDNDKEYPHEVRDVVKLYSRMITCVYGRELADDGDLKKMVKQMQKLYADELKKDPNNSVDNQTNALQAELDGYGENDHKITTYVIAENSQVEYATVDDQKSAAIDVEYTMRSGNNYPKNTVTYILVQDENEHWKILGWQEQDPTTIK